MQKTFNKDEITKLITFHKELLESLSDIVDEKQVYSKKIKKLAEKFAYSRSFDGDVIQYISEHKNVDRTSYAAELIMNVYLYAAIDPAASSASSLLREYQQNILTLINTAKHGRSSVRWLFTSSKNKDIITRSVEALRTGAESAYVSKAQETIMKAETVKSVNDETVLTDFAADANKKKYRLAFTECTGGFPEPKIREFESLIKTFDGVSKLIGQVDERGREIEEEIKQSALRLTTQESLKILSDISVDEVNRESKGIRVKTLKDAGYMTVADIYAASVYELEAINGISEARAFELKRIAEKIAMNSCKGAKFRLSTDSKTQASTSLVTLLYSYREYKKSTNELREYTEKPQAEAERALKELSSLGSSVQWLFYNTKEKDDIADSFCLLDRLRSEGYAENVRRIVSRIPFGYKTSDSAAAWKDFEENSIRYYNILENLLPGLLGDQNTMYGLPEELARDIQDQSFFPEGLLCELRNYQVWGVKYILHQERALLGDEMGLGKTVQAIASMVSLRNTGETHFAVVCPASVLTNWCREIRKHSKLRVIKIHGSDRTSALRQWKESGGVAVTTYETTGYFKLDDDFRFGMAVVDEAHYIKNPSAKRTVNVKELCQHTKRLLFMTGTALENKVDEMISLIEVLRPQIAQQIRPIAYMNTAPQFREAIAPVYFRRKREDVLTELPELIESEEWCSLMPEETEVYKQSLWGRNIHNIRRISWNVDDLENSCKAQRMKELISEAASEDRKILVFSFYRDTIKKICMMLGSSCLGPITGDISPAQRQSTIDDFEKAPPGTVLVAQIQAGGTGLNIQSASVVIICEPQVKPSIENQAISRAYRMGQTRSVLVYKLLCEDSIDERMVEILRSKQQSFDAFADESAAARESIELDTASFNKIINDEIERINAANGQQQV